MTQVFDAESTADEVVRDIDLTGRTALVTGSSGGIGLEAARALASRGAGVVLAARDIAKLDAAASELLTAQPNATVETLQLDLASLASVRAAAAEFLGRHDRLDLLINNAGVMCTPFGRTADGFETQFGTNHLGHFLVTNLLQPALLAAGEARVVNLSSNGHSMGTIDFDDPHFQHRPYDGWVAYGQSKTANILFTVELDRRLSDAGVRSFAVHPGVIQTGLGRYMSKEDSDYLRRRLKETATAPTTKPFRFKSIPQGAATTVWAATSRDLDGIGGRYCEDCALAAPAGEAGSGGYQAYAVDPSTASRLWSMSESMVGLDST
jgi:NAD(P)-dependent dehydrogenase (short-subunit alcohol dehydrogenase family)